MHSTHCSADAFTTLLQFVGPAQLAIVSTAHRSVVPLVKQHYVFTPTQVEEALSTVHPRSLVRLIDVNTSLRTSPLVQYLFTATLQRLAVARRFRLSLAYVNLAWQLLRHFPVLRTPTHLCAFFQQVVLRQCMPYYVPRLLAFGPSVTSVQDAGSSLLHTWLKQALYASQRKVVRILADHLLAPVVQRTQYQRVLAELLN